MEGFIEGIIGVSKRIRKSVPKLNLAKSSVGCKTRPHKKARGYTHLKVCPTGR